MFNDDESCLRAKLSKLFFSLLYSITMQETMQADRDVLNF